VVPALLELSKMRKTWILIGLFLFSAAMTMKFYQKHPRGRGETLSTKRFLWLVLAGIGNLENRARGRFLLV